MMTVEITGEYLGGKKCRLTHGPSGSQLTTAAPLDNQGDGSSFSPTDLVAAALASCVMTVMGIIAERDGLDLMGMTVRIEKHMSAAPPRRIARLTLTLTLPATLAPEQRQKLERAARACPVDHSLHPEIAVEPTFVYQ